MDNQHRNEPSKRHCIDDNNAWAVMDGYEYLRPIEHVRVEMCGSDPAFVEAADEADTPWAIRRIA